MKNSIFPILLLINIQLVAQQLPVDSLYNKWIKSIINIDVRENILRKGIDLFQALNENKISKIEYLNKYDSLVLHARAFSGTAILLEEKGNHFLLTARHVLYDASVKDSNEIVETIILIENDSLLNQHNTKRDSNHDVVIIPYDYDAIVVPGSDMIFISNLNYGPYEDNPYVFSSINDDIAIVCLDCDLRTAGFYQALKRRGYKYITIKDIDTVFAAKKGDKIYSIGFPENSKIREREVAPLYIGRESSIVSIPVITQGIYLKEYPNKSNFFDAMMFVYHGFSGAPIIKKNKIIGIVNGGHYSEKFLTGNKIPFKYIIQNHSKFVKSTVIISTLKKLIDKIKKFPDYYPPYLH